MSNNLFQNCKWSHYQWCSLRGELLWEAIRNSRWPFNLILAVTCLTCSPELLHIKLPGFPEKILEMFLRSLVSFRTDLKFKVAALVSDWRKHLWFFSPELLHAKSPFCFEIWGFQIWKQLKEFLKRSCLNVFPIG
jgi:hypothetical protein